MTVSRTLLLTGGTGLLGQGLVATTPPGWTIVSVHLRPYTGGAPAVREAVVDVRSRLDLERVFGAHRFDAVVHAAGISSVDYSEQHEDESRESNLGGTRNVAALCAAAGIPLTYVSTNAVFDGTRAPYGEGDALNPVNAYGRIKMACERLVAETVPRHAIARPILMYGWPHPMGRPNPVTWVIDALRRRETIHVVDDVYENPLYNLDGGRAVWAMLDRGIGGVVHLAGRDVVSRYELARLVARVFALDETLIRPVPSEYFAAIAPRPRNTSFVTERMESELGVRACGLEQGLRLMAS